MKPSTEAKKAVTAKLTLAILQESFSGNISEGIEFAKTFFASYPSRPTKPQLVRSATSVDVKKYAEALESWEAMQKNYEKEKEHYRKVQGEVEEIIIQFIKDAAGFSSVPEKSKSKVWSKAYSDGHSYGYYEVYAHLVELVDLFN